MSENPKIAAARIEVARTRAALIVVQAALTVVLLARRPFSKNAAR